jgi:hypothetical protein
MPLYLYLIRSVLKQPQCAHSPWHPWLPPRRGYVLHSTPDPWQVNMSLYPDLPHIPVPMPVLTRSGSAPSTSVALLCAIPALLFTSASLLPMMARTMPVQWFDLVQIQVLDSSKYKFQIFKFWNVWGTIFNGFSNLKSIPYFLYLTLQCLTPTYLWIIDQRPLSINPSVN